MVINLNLGYRQLISLTMKEFDKCFWEIQTPLGMLMQLSFLSSDDQKLTGDLKLWFLQYNSDGAIVSSSFQWWSQHDQYFLYETTNAMLVIQVPAGNVSVVTLKCEFFSGMREHAVYKQVSCEQCFFCSNCAIFTM